MTVHKAKMTIDKEYKVAEIDKRIYGSFIERDHFHWLIQHFVPEAYLKEAEAEGISGHHEGMKVVRQTTKLANELGVKALTLYAFSTENWKRPKLEVDFLMKLPEEFLGTSAKG